MVGTLPRRRRRRCGCCSRDHGRDPGGHGRRRYRRASCRLLLPVSGAAGPGCRRWRCLRLGRYSATGCDHQGKARGVCSEGQRWWVSPGVAGLRLHSVVGWESEAGAAGGLTMPGSRTFGCCRGVRMPPRWCGNGRGSAPCVAWFRVCCEALTWARPVWRWPLVGTGVRACSRTLPDCRQRYRFKRRCAGRRDRGDVRQRWKTRAGRGGTTQRGTDPRHNAVFPVELTLPLIQPRSSYHYRGPCRTPLDFQGDKGEAKQWAYCVDLEAAGGAWGWGPWAQRNNVTVESQNWAACAHMHVLRRHESHSGCTSSVH